ncbi:MAG: 50S ribosomal protein L24e [Candidatus Atabeyarchaeum deiterrae]|jgi:large subunit ribosomal protein L24e
MVRETRCLFCGSNIKAGTGIIYVKNDGVAMNFCSSKCRKSMIVLKRDPRKLKWTKVHSEKLREAQKAKETRAAKKSKATRR